LLLTVNWNSKSDNARSLATRLKVALDCVIFIDDNPQEVQSMRFHLPQVCSICLNHRTCNFGALYFAERNPDTLTAVDETRSQFYKEEKERQLVRASTASFDEFLQSIDLTVVFVSMSSTDANYDRAQQLLLRTSQFNSYPNDPSVLLLQGHGVECVLLDVSDKFGAYGLTGLLCMDVANAVVNCLLLSCRVLGRGVEEKLFGYVAMRMREANHDQFRIRYRVTARNVPVIDCLKSLSKQSQLMDEEGYVSISCEVAVMWRMPPVKSEVSECLLWVSFCLCSPLMVYSRLLRRPNVYPLTLGPMNPWLSTMTKRLQKFFLWIPR
jgi:FkbH-like protein